MGGGGGERRRRRSAGLAARSPLRCGMPKTTSRGARRANETRRRHLPQQTFSAVLVALARLQPRSGMVRVTADSGCRGVKGDGVARVQLGRRPSLAAGRWRGFNRQEIMFRRVASAWRESKARSKPCPFADLLQWALWMLTSIACTTMSALEITAGHGQRPAWVSTRPPPPGRRRRRSPLAACRADEPRPREASDTSYSAVQSAVQCILKCMVAAAPGGRLCGAYPMPRAPTEARRCECSPVCLFRAPSNPMQHLIGLPPLRSVEY